jgi:hypothetical protein
VSWLRGELFQGHVQFDVECDLMQYENEVETFAKIHSQNLLGENIFEGVKNHPRMTICK